MTSLLTHIPHESSNTEYALFTRQMIHSPTLRTIRPIVRTFAPFLTKQIRPLSSQSPSPDNHLGDDGRPRFPSRYTSIGKIAKNSHPVQNLDPRRLLPSDFQDWSGNVCVALATPRPGDTTYYRTTLTYRKYCVGQNYVDEPFPGDTRGFLYFNRPPDRPLLASDIRFRKVDGPYPACFTAGEDLCLPNGTPWALPLLSSHRSRRFDGLIALLVRDGLISQNDLSRLPDITQRHDGHELWLLRHRSLVLSTLDQPIHINLAGYTHFWVLTSDDKVLCGCISHREGRTSEGSKGKQYTGTVLCRLELSDRPEHKNTRTLVLRILDILEEPKRLDAESDVHFSTPVLGELLSHLWRVNAKSGLPEVWSCNVDRCGSAMRPLRYLVDAYERQRKP